MEAVLSVSEATKLRFEAKLLLQESGCIYFSGASQLGYGVFWFNGQNVKAHRMAWFIANGEIPSDRIVMHTCDNGLCVNLDHLRLGTHQENTDDMVQKGRKPISYGEDNRASKIKLAIAQAIKADLLSGLRHMEIARKYNVTRGIVKHIDNGVTWREA
jgi:hypothetical protein